MADREAGKDVPVEKASGDAEALKAQVDLARPPSLTKLDISTEIRSRKAPLRANSASGTAKRPPARTNSTSINAPMTSRASAVTSSIASRSVTTADSRQTHGSSLNRPPTKPPVFTNARRTTAGTIPGRERDASSMLATAEEEKRSASRSSVSKPSSRANATSATSKRTSLLRSSTTSGPSTAKNSTATDRRSSVVPRTSAMTTAPTSATGRTTAASQSVKPSVRASLSGAVTGSAARTRTARVGNKVSDVANKFGTKSELSRRMTAATSTQKLRSNTSVEEAQVGNATDEAKFAPADLEIATATSLDENEIKSTNDTKKPTFTENPADIEAEEINEDGNVVNSLERQVTNLQAEVEKLRTQSLPRPTSPEIYAKALHAEHTEELRTVDTKNIREVQGLRNELEIKGTLQAEVDELRKEIVTLKQSLTEAQDAIKQEEVTKETAKAELIRSNDDLSSSVSDLQAHVSSLSDSHKDGQARAQTKIVRLETEIQNYKKESEDLLQEKKDITVLSNNNEDLKARNRALEEENNTLAKEKSVVSDNAFSESQKLKDESTHLRKQFQEELKTKDSEIDAYQERLTEANTLQKSLQSVKSERDEELLSTNRVVEELQTEIQRLLQTDSDGSRAIQGLQEDLKRSEQRYCEELREKECQIGSLRDTADNLKKDINDLQQQKMLLEEDEKREASHLQTKVVALREELTEAKQKTDEMQAEKDTEIRELTQVIEGLQQDIVAFKQNDHDAERLSKEENEKLRQEALSLREQLEGEQKDKSELTKVNNGQLTVLETSVASLEKENSQLREEQEKLTSEKNYKIEKLQQANEVLKQSEGEAKSLREDCLKFKDEIKTLESAKNAAEEKATAINEEATSLQKVLETFDKDSKEKEQQQSASLYKAEADLQSALKSHQAELQILRDEHANELCKATDSFKLENNKQLEELQAKENALLDERRKTNEEQISLIETTKTELEDKYKQEISELQTRHDSLVKTNAELTESSSGTQKLLEDELDRVRTDFDTNRAKHDEAQKIKADSLLDLQDRLHSITSEKQGLLETQKKLSSKMQEDHELALKRLTEDFNDHLATLRKEQSDQEQSIKEGTIAFERTIQGLEARCAQFKSSADMAVIVEDQSKLLKPRIQELEAEVASLKAQLKCFRMPEMERLSGTSNGLSDSKWAVSGGNASDLAINANNECSVVDTSTTKSQISSEGDRMDDGPRDGAWSADISLEGTMAGIQVQARQLEELNKEFASESKRMINMVGEHVQRSHPED